MTVDIVRTLSEIRSGDTRAMDRLFPILYDELHVIADRQMKKEDTGNTLQPTALVHEAYLRLLPHRNVDPADRTRFLGIAASAMRRVLIDRARDKKAQKRGGGADRITLTESLQSDPNEIDVDVEALDAALKKLEELNPRSARVVELKFFGGLKREEISEELGVSVRTVADDWTMAKRWLSRELSL